jgi:hypothetical protein
MSVGEYTKGDSINWECTVGVNITGWKIRCEISDKSSRIKLANLASGGSETQIEMKTLATGIFIVHVPKNATAPFLNKKADIEIEIETNDTPSQKYTLLQDEIELTEQKIDWETPS